VAGENGAAAAENGTPDGLFVRGTYLGRQPSREFTFRGTQDKGVQKAAIGIAVAGGEISVEVGDDDDLSRETKGLVKGDRIEYAVEAVPPFGSRGAVKFRRPGLSDRTWL